VEIAYRDYRGNGRAVVLLPGVGGNLEAEHETAVALADRWRIVTVDLRGIGQSGEPETITASDFVVDVETVVDALKLRGAAVVGHSLGGVVAGLYGTAHSDAPVVSIDGFDAGVASVGTPEDHAELHRFMDRARRSLRAMTAAPAEGDDDWRAQQIQSITDALDTMGFHASNRSAMVARQFVPLPDGRWRRHPSAKLVDAAERAALGTEPTANIVRMFRTCTGPVLILRCTRSEWPAVLDAELDDLTATHPNITVTRLPLTHTGPVTDGVDLTAAEISTFLSRHLPPFQGTTSRTTGAIPVWTSVT
jgi:pimeloyl-ACP methyl ester carboxylesterase